MSQDHVFVSYSSLDFEFALRLSADLKNRGVSVWMDRLEQGIAPGDTWSQTLDDALKQSVAVIAIVTSEYLQSSYCRDEVEFAFRTRRRLYPLRLRPIDDAAKPFWLEGIQFTDFTRWRDADAYTATLETLITAIGSSNPQQLRAAPDPESQYLTRLIADLRARRGVVGFSPLRAQLAAQRRPAPAEDEFGFASLRPQVAEASVDCLETRDVSDVLRALPRCVLLGDAGAGKTTTLRRIALGAAIDRQLHGRNTSIPIVLSLSEWSNQSLEDFFAQHWPFASDPGALLAAGEIAVFVDGLNEMGQLTEAHAEELRTWLKSARGPARVIFTCRSSDYEGLGLGLPTVTLQPLDEREIAAYVAVYLGPESDTFRKALTKSDAIRLASNPYFLGALIYLYEHRAVRELPVNRGLLLAQLTRALWERERLRQTEGWSPYATLVAKLGKAAYDGLVTGRGITADRATMEAEELPGIDAIAGAQLIELLPTSIQFSHQMLRDYFAAAWLDAQNDPLDGARHFFSATTPDHGGQHWYWNTKVWMGLTTEQRAFLLTLLGLSSQRGKWLRMLCLDHPDIAADLAEQGDAELALSEGDLNDIQVALQARVQKAQYDEVSYGLSSYDGDSEQLMAIDSVGDSVKIYRERAERFSEWRKRRKKPRSRHSGKN